MWMRIQDPTRAIQAASGLAVIQAIITVVMLALGALEPLAWVNVALLSVGALFLWRKQSRIAAALLLGGFVLWRVMALVQLGLAPSWIMWTVVGLAVYGQALHATIRLARYGAPQADDVYVY